MTTPGKRLKTSECILQTALAAMVLWAIPAHAAPFAYVTNAGDNTVSVIDSATNTVRATIPVGLYPVAVAVTPDGMFAYVANANSNDVSVVATSANSRLGNARQQSMHHQRKWNFRGESGQ